MILPAEAKEHAEYRHLAMALEGIAGCLHSGRPVEPRDLARACVVAQMVWEAGPDPGRTREAAFNDARTRLADTAKPDTLAETRGAVRAESAAHDMALELRWMANDLSRRPVRRQAPDLDRAIGELQARYARFGIRTAA